MPKITIVELHKKFIFMKFSNHFKGRKKEKWLGWNKCHRKHFQRQKWYCKSIPHSFGVLKGKFQFVVYQMCLFKVTDIANRLETCLMLQIMSVSYRVIRDCYKYITWCIIQFVLMNMVHCCIHMIGQMPNFYQMLFTFYIMKGKGRMIINWRWKDVNI